MRFKGCNMSDYSYEDYERCMKHLLDTMWRDSDALEIGENISDVREVKIIFDGYGDLDEEEYIEGGDKNMESYAIFIHKDSLQEDFEFPEHEMTPWCLIHRPKDEVCIYAWYNVEEDYWDIIPLEDRVYDTAMNEDDVMKILLGLEKKYYV
jgi:hypothetical protein